MFPFENEAEEKELRQALDIIQRLYSRYYCSDSLIAVGRNMRFGDDPHFVDTFYAEAGNSVEASLAWRLHTLCWAAFNALKLEGDFVECGVHRGFCTSMVAKYIHFERHPQRKWYLYDTFSGVPEDQTDPGMVDRPWYREPDLKEYVEQRFAAFPNIVVCKGRVPEVLAESCPEKVAFMHLDMNSSKAEIGALEVLYDRMVPGAYLVLDDYGWYEYRQQTIAEDLFFAERGCRVLELPTGQGLVVKQ